MDATPPPTPPVPPASSLPQPPPASAGNAVPPLPPGGMPSQENRLIALLAHLITFMSSFIGPLVIYLLKRDESPFVGDHAKEVLNFHLSVLLYVVGLAVTVVGVILIPVLGVFVMVVTIMGAIRAYDGQPYRYPLCIRFVK